VNRRAAAPLDAYVLHRYDWSETSLILDLFTRARGRLAVAAKGAKRPYSQLRSVLLPFQRLAVTVGRQAEDAQAEVLTLRGAEWAGADATPVLPSPRLFAGFYLNEMLMKLMPRGEVQPALFDAYSGTLAALAVADDANEQAALRAFELILLREGGLLPELDRLTATQQAVDPAHGYLVHAERGVIDAAGGVLGIPGRDLLAIDVALRRGDADALRTACARTAESLRPVLRLLVHYHLGSPTLRTRAVMRDVRQMIAAPGASR